MLSSEIYMTCLKCQPPHVTPKFTKQNQTIQIFTFNINASILFHTTAWKTMSLTFHTKCNQVLSLQNNGIFQTFDEIILQIKFGMNR